MSKIWDALQRAEENRNGNGTSRAGPHRAQLTPKQVAAVQALLKTDCLAEAAELSGVSERTLRRWIALPSFVNAFYAAGHDQLAGALNRLRATTGEAVDVLKGALEAEDPFVRIRAAAAILQAVGDHQTAPATPPED